MHQLKLQLELQVAQAEHEVSSFLRVCLTGVFPAWMDASGHFCAGIPPTGEPPLLSIHGHSQPFSA